MLLFAQTHLSVSILRQNCRVGARVVYFFQFLEAATYIDKKPLKFRVDIWIQMLHMDSGLYGLNVCFDQLCLVYYFVTNVGEMML